MDIQITMWLPGGSQAWLGCRRYPRDLISCNTATLSLLLVSFFFTVDLDLQRARRFELRLYFSNSQSPLSSMSFRLRPTLNALRGSPLRRLRGPSHVRTLMSRDQYFLKPLKGEAEQPTFEYKFLAQPATVEVGYMMFSSDPDCRVPVLWRPATRRRRERPRVPPGSRTARAAVKARVERGSEPGEHRGGQAARQARRGQHWQDQERVCRQRGQ